MRRIGVALITVGSLPLVASIGVGLLLGLHLYASNYIPSQKAIALIIGIFLQNAVLVGIGIYLASKPKKSN